MTKRNQLRHTAQTTVDLARKSVLTLQDQGWRGLYSKVRRRVSPPKMYQPEWSKSYTAEALMLTQWLDCTPEEVQRSKAVMAANNGPMSITTINWYLPHFENAYFGGVHTILRFAAAFAREHGVDNRFIILGDASAPTETVYLERISEPFPDLARSEVVVIKSDLDLPRVPDSDACIATLFSTAYYVLKNNRTKRKFYFIQDFEPMFYPAGSSSAVAEATYSFGFYGLTNTVTLKEHYEQDYGGTATFFRPSVDTNIFYPPQQRNWTRKPYKLFFYGRPNHWRNGFELGAAALRKVKDQLGAKVQIVAAGHAWSPADYGLDGVVEPLGLLPYRATADLYRTCDAGLVMMFTRHPSYLPFEFMASGCLVVTNVNHTTSWLLKDGENCLLSLPTASCIANTIVLGLEDVERRKQITINALNMIQSEYAHWSGQSDHIYQYMCNPQN